MTTEPNPFDPFDPNQPPRQDASKSALLSLYGWASLVSGPLSAYHGYKRNNSVAWGVAWFFLGSVFPVLTPTIALAQGFGKRPRKA